MKRILLVEDEPTIRTAVRDALRGRGFEVDDTIDGAEGLRRAQRDRYDLIVLDVMLPGLDGFEVCRRLRAESNHTPILILTARGTEDDRVKGLSLGADDYVPKPFSVRELLARVDACLRRSDWGSGKEGTGSVLRTDQVEIDLDRQEGRCGDREPASLTPKEVEILRYLAAHRERVVSRQEFLVGVWGYPSGTDIVTRTVENTIGKLRRKIEADSKNPDVIITVHGSGWKLGDSVRCED